MLNNAFLVHDGWKFPKQFYAKKDVDSAQNRLLFQYHFKDELPRKYNTNRTCSPVEPYRHALSNNVGCSIFDVVVDHFLTFVNLTKKMRENGKSPLKGPGQFEILNEIYTL